jgi:hypothetical protein
MNCACRNAARNDAFEYSIVITIIPDVTRHVATVAPAVPIRTSARTHAELWCESYVLKHRMA